MVEPAAGPQLPEVLGEQIERDEGDDEHAGSGDDGARLRPALDDSAHQDHDPDGLEGRHEEQRDPGDPGPGQLGAVDGGERGEQPARGASGATTAAVSPAGGRLPVAGSAPDTSARTMLVT